MVINFIIRTGKENENIKHKIIMFIFKEKIPELIRRWLRNMYFLLSMDFIFKTFRVTEKLKI